MATHTTALPFLDTTEPLQVAHQETVRLGNQAQQLQVTHGVVWLTSDGTDLILKTGEMTTLPKQMFPAVMTAMSSSGASVVLSREVEHVR